ncbi:salicylate hydroxylase [Glonium stellatum]|uniref:Salicylate hydroxylase n=1 Tax=Glonium stellatum TaxID=574774 RepID=A0A8E2EYT5_9PEZI|nr:salicylate hydroxylase [Glonium stellatum]
MTSPSNPEPVRVIVVGAGFAGLTAAIECKRKGCSVLMLESFKELKPLGDVISFGGNAGTIFQRWPGVEEQLDPICHTSDRLAFYDYRGDHIYTQVWADEVEYGKKFNGHRGEIHEIVYKHALSVGVEIRLDQRVAEYFETDTEAGVVVNGERITADVIFAADGVRSTARKIVLGHEDKPKSSGYAVYRAWMPSDDLAKNPLTAHLVNDGDKHVGYLGPDIHFLAASLKNGKDFSWVLTHKDEADVEESWSAPGDVEDAVRVVEGWTPIVHAIIRATPQEKLVDWKLVYRDPLPTWISPKARIALVRICKPLRLVAHEQFAPRTSTPPLHLSLPYHPSNTKRQFILNSDQGGDAAHPFLPTSIQGASQAMEDGTTFAVCLQLAGKAKIPEAVRAYEKIRYDRVKAAQKTGETTRDKWHKTDFDRLKANPTSIKLAREKWLLDHDAEAHAYAAYADTVASLRPNVEPRPSL